MTVEMMKVTKTDYDAVKEEQFLTTKLSRAGQKISIFLALNIAEDSKMLGSFEA